MKIIIEKQQYNGQTQYTEKSTNKLIEFVNSYHTGVIKNERRY